MQLNQTGLNQAQILALKTLQQMGHNSGDVLDKVLDQVGKQYPLDSYDRQHLEQQIPRTVTGVLAARSQNEGLMQMWH